MSDFLGEFEQMVLLAVLRLGDHAYGLKVGDEIEQVADRRPSSGSLYTTLDRLEEKGFLLSDVERGPDRRVGRPRRYFRLTPEGIAALRKSRHALMQLWAGHTELLDGREGAR